MTRGLKTFPLDLDEFLPFGVDWTDWIAKEGFDPELTTFTWVVPPELTGGPEQAQTIQGRRIAVIWLEVDASAELGGIYRVTCRLTETAVPGRIADRSFLILVREN